MSLVTRPHTLVSCTARISGSNSFFGILNYRYVCDIVAISHLLISACSRHPTAFLNNGQLVYHSGKRSVAVVGDMPGWIHFW